MIRFETVISALRRQLKSLPKAFKHDSVSDSKAPVIGDTIEECEAIDTFRKVNVYQIEIKKLDGKTIPFCLEFTSPPFAILMNENITEQIKKIYKTIRRMAEYKVGMEISKQKIKSVIGDNRDILFGKWDLRNYDNKICFSCKVNVWATSQCLNAT